MALIISVVEIYLLMFYTVMVTSRPTAKLRDEKTSNSFVEMFSRVARSAFPAVARGFSSVKAGNHAPPKKIYGTIGRYAEAVYTASSKV